MLFDIEIVPNSNVVKISSSNAEWTFSITDLNNHSSSWLINQITGRGDSEIL